MIIDGLRAGHEGRWECSYSNLLRSEFSW